MNLLPIVRPFIPYLPEMQAPGKRISFQEKFVWTTVATLIYLVASQVPLYGILDKNTHDPIHFMRMMMASNRGTLMDLGISPVISAGMIIQFLQQLGLIATEVSEDKVLLKGFTMILSLIMTFAQALIQVLTGFYGSLDALKSIVLLTQLVFSGVIIILLDELLSKGYGLGNGVNLFIAANVCENIVWKAFSPISFNTSRGMECEGVFVELCRILISTKKGGYTSWSKAYFNGFWHLIFRENLPNLMELLTTLSLFAIVIYLYGIRLELPTQSVKVRASGSPWPVRLLYSGTMPIILQSYIVGHTCTVSKLLYKYFPLNPAVKLLGVWGINYKGRSVAMSGLCHFISGFTFSDAFSRPLAFSFYVLLMLISAGFFSRAWIDVNENNGKNISSQMQKQGITVKNVRQENLQSYLDNYIPVAAFAGGVLIGLVVLLSNLWDTIGSGSNIILAVGIVWQYNELFVKENLKSIKNLD